MSFSEALGRLKSALDDPPFFGILPKAHCTLVNKDDLANALCLLEGVMQYLEGEYLLDKDKGGSFDSYFDYIYAAFEYAPGMDVDHARDICRAFERDGVSGQKLSKSVVKRLETQQGTLPIDTEGTG